MGCWHYPAHLKREYVPRLCIAFTGLPTRLGTTGTTCMWL